MGKYEPEIHLQVGWIRNEVLHGGDFRLCIFCLNYSDLLLFHTNNQTDEFIGGTETSTGQSQTAVPLRSSLGNLWATTPLRNPDPSEPSPHILASCKPCQQSHCHYSTGLATGVSLCISVHCRGYDWGSSAGHRSFSATPKGTDTP